MRSSAVLPTPRGLKTVLDSKEEAPQVKKTYEGEEKKQRRALA